MWKLTRGVIVNMSITRSVDNRRSKSTIGADKVDVDSRAPTDVAEVGTEPRDSRPSVCLESRPLELLAAVLCRSACIKGGTSRSLRGSALGCGDGVALLRGDLAREGTEGTGDDVEPGAALDFLGGGENAGSSVALAGASTTPSPTSMPTRTAARSSTVDSKRPRRSFAPRSNL